MCWTLSPLLMPSCCLSRCGRFLAFSSWKINYTQSGCWEYHCAPTPGIVTTVLLAGHIWSWWCAGVGGSQRVEKLRKCPKWTKSRLPSQDTPLEEEGSLSLPFSSRGDLIHFIYGGIKMGVTKNACKAEATSQRKQHSYMGTWKGLGKRGGDWRLPHGSMSWLWKPRGLWKLIFLSNSIHMVQTEIYPARKQTTKRKEKSKRH